jgi:ubiquinone/menaquinone biosynthesis C-methylase UbiE
MARTTHENLREKRFKLIPEMEGRQARWYARQRRSGGQPAAYRARAAELAAALPDGAAVLEVAPGPGYLAVELARGGRVGVHGVDVSRTMVQIAAEHAAEQGVEADFRQGDVADLPFPDATFDLVVTQAAFKNFTAPVRALDEIHRVLKPGGTAIVEDMSADATDTDIAAEVDAMALNRVNTFVTNAALHVLRRRAYGRATFEALAERSRFGTAEITTAGITVTVTLRK